MPAPATRSRCPMPSAKRTTPDQTPSCYKSVASVQLPGLLKLISGSITINKQLSVKGNSKALLTLQKNSWLVGVVCKDGKSQNFLVPDKDCSIDICSLSKSICTVLETPGTHQLNELESDVGSNGTITLPSASSALKPLLKGQWKLELKLMVMDINLPSNTDWLWLDE
ncbi:hypothetical protein M3Y99_00200500 [Aphelenchoides fujianensis]|nr:hypothetical protein M3Y99_00200500 [Aphelenchoides fujianensis]